jgi:hypothetical protein
MTDSPSELNQPEWPEILRQLQETVMGRIHTSLPGIVRAYDTPTQTAKVQLAVQLKGRNVPPIDDVPVIWPGGAAGFLHVPLAAGDTVQVLFCEEDFSKWLTTGSVSAPAVLARCGLHAVALAGLRTRTAPFAATGGHVTLAATSELRLGSDAASVYVALASLVDARFEAMRTFINAHTHGSHGAPTVPSLLEQDSVAATKVKAI